MARVKSKHFFGFGLGPLQAGLFLLEAWRSRKFARLTVCEIDPRLVDALKDGRLTVNVAGENGLVPVVIDGIEVLHPCLLYTSHKRALRKTMTCCQAVVAEAGGWADG